MSKDEKEVSPIITAQNFVPWWMMQIGEFDGLEIKSYEIIGHTLLGSKITQPCEPKHASFWSVCGRYKSSGEVSNGIEHFEDFATEAEAQNFYDRLLKTYPHLRDDRPRARYNIILPTFTH